MSWPGFNVAAPELGSKAEALFERIFVLSAIESAALFFNEETERVVKRWRSGEEVVEIRQRP